MKARNYVLATTLLITALTMTACNTLDTTATTAAHSNALEPAPLSISAESVTISKDGSTIDFVGNVTVDVKSGTSVDIESSSVSFDPDSGSISVVGDVIISVAGNRLRTDNALLVPVDGQPIDPGNWSHADLEIRMDSAQVANRPR